MPLDYRREKEVEGEGDGRSSKEIWSERYVGVGTGGIVKEREDRAGGDSDSLGAGGGWVRKRWCIVRKKRGDLLFGHQNNLLRWNFCLSLASAAPAQVCTASAFALVSCRRHCGLHGPLPPTPLRRGTRDQRHQLAAPLTTDHRLGGGGHWAQVRWVSFAGRGAARQRTPRPS